MRRPVVVSLFERARVAFLVLALGWSLWPPCVCSAAIHEQPAAAHCASHDGGEEGLRAGLSDCCCGQNATLQSPPATVARETLAGPLHAALAPSPVPVLASTEEPISPRAPAAVADSPPPRLIALRI